MPNGSDQQQAFDNKFREFLRALAPTVSKDYCGAIASDVWDAGVCYALDKIRAAIYSHHVEVCDRLSAGDQGAALVALIRLDGLKIAQKLLEPPK